MNATDIKRLKKLLRSRTYITNEVTFYFDCDGHIDLLGWNFIPGLKGYIINEIFNILEFGDGNYIDTKITIEYDKVEDIASISHNGGFWCNIEPNE